MTVLFNPYTGKPRHPSDIASDPEGILIWDGETPLNSAPAKTPAERKAAERQRRSDAGLVRLELYAHPDDHAAIKEHAAKLQAKRARAARQGR